MTVVRKSCECGCGSYPIQVGSRFVRGHSVQRPAPERFWEKVNKNGPIPAHRPDLGPCWLWLRYKNREGYGDFNPGRGNGGETHAHRWAYVYLVGPISNGLTLDHLCRIRNCVNPRHLEPVTAGVNILRGATLAAANLAKTHCCAGHPFTPENTYYSPSAPNKRQCRECKRISNRAYKQARRRAKVRAA